MSNSQLLDEELQLLLKQVSPTAPDSDMKQNLHSLQELFSSLSEKEVSISLKFSQIIT